MLLWCWLALVARAAAQASGRADESVGDAMRQAAARARVAVEAGIVASLAELGGSDATLSLATLVGLHAGDEQVSVAQHVNVLLVGVAPPRLSDAAAALEPWFEHVTRTLPHVLAPVGAAQTTTEPTATPRTAIAFNASLSFVELSPRVASVLEEVLVRNLRPEAVTCGRGAADDDAPDDSCSVHTGVLGDPDLGLDRYYVDATRFSRVLADLVRALGLDRAFSLFVLNLRSPVDREHATYGYRVGFSRAELADLRANASRLSLPHKQHTPPRWRARRAAAAVPPLDTRRFISKVAESDAWATATTAALFQARALRNYAVGSVAQRAAAQAQLSADELARLTQRCDDVDADDLVCQLRVEAAALDSAFDLAADVAALGTADDKRYVQQVLRDQSGVIRPDCLVDAWLSHERVAFLDLGAGPFDWGPTVAAAGVKTYDSFPRMPAADVVARELADAAKANASAPLEPARFADKTAAFAEASLLAVYRNVHCAFGIDRVCAQLAERAAQLQSSPLAQRPWLGAVSRDATAAVGTTPSEDEFLSELAHVVLGLGVRQLFLPPASLFAPVLERSVSFHLFVVSDHDEYAQLDELAFDWQRVQGELRALQLPYQEFNFRVTSVALNEEPKLVAALAASLRTATLPTLDADGHFSAVPTRYVDAAALQERLLTLHVAGDRRGVTVDAARNINLFLFSLGDEMPLLVDKYHQAKALDDMVVIVQSNARNFSSRFVCNGAMVDTDLRNPTHATLGALGTLLGGLVPAHIQYELTRGAASQDWRWAVGARPTVISSSSLLSRFGQVSRDVALRNAALSAVTDSLDRLRAIERDLSGRHLHIAVSKLARTSLAAIGGELAAWRAAVTFVAQLVSDMRFEAAAHAALHLRDLMFAAEQNVTALQELHAKHSCTVNNWDMRRSNEEAATAAAAAATAAADTPTTTAPPRPRSTPSAILPWRSSFISVLLVVQVALVLFGCAWRMWRTVAHPQLKVKVN